MAARAPSASYAHQLHGDHVPDQSRKRMLLVLGADAAQPQQISSTLGVPVRHMTLGVPGLYKALPYNSPGYVTDR